MAGLVAASLLVGCQLTGCLESPPDPAVAISADRSFGEPGTSPGQFAYPRVMESVRQQGQPHLFVIDKAARIQWFEGDADRPRTLWKTPHFERGRPTGLAVHFNPDDPAALPVLYIADTHESRILIQQPPAAMGQEPTTIASIGTYGYEPGQFIYPCDIELLLDDAGRIERFYVSEYGGHDRVSVFDKDWNFLFSFGEHGNAWEQQGTGLVFNRPQSLLIDRDRRELWIADAINHRVGRFTLEGELLGWLGEGGPSKAPGRFEFPYSLAMLDGGGLLVGEYGNSRVQLLDPATGERLALFGSPGRGPSELLNPWDIATDDGRLLVLDSGNARVSEFALPTGVRLAHRAGGAP